MNPKMRIKGIALLYDVSTSEDFSRPSHGWLLWAPIVHQQLMGNPFAMGISRGGICARAIGELDSSSLLPKLPLHQMLPFIKINEIDSFPSSIFLHIGTSLLSLSSCGYVSVCMWFADHLPAGRTVFRQTFQI